MLQFKHTEIEDLGQFKPYFAVQNTHIGDYSLGFQFMWHKYLAPDFAFTDGCLVLRELFAGKYYFYYPLSLAGDGAEEERAISSIEKFCRDGDIRLRFTNVPRRALPALVLRYGDVSVTDNRRWRDYLYDADAFRLYPGGKYAGQRNHVNKFRKAYPDWSFRACGKDDLPLLTDFLSEYAEAQRNKHNYLADEELDEVYAVLPKFEELGMFCGGLFVGNKLVGFSAGERCGDMVLVHIEKALRSFEGAYPMLAQQFALAFCGNGVRFLNRMDDAGDMGLRKSKLQYGPCELVDKYNVIPARAIDNVSHLPTVHTERLVLAPVEKKDEERYFRLASDVERNRYWGYDWREGRTSKRMPSAAWFLKCAREDFRHRLEMPLGIFFEGELMGEAVLHRFGYASEAEIGVRLLPEAEGKGYAREALRGLTDYAFSKLGLGRVEAKCFRENTRSRAALEGAGMRACGEDGIFSYFVRTPEM